MNVELDSRDGAKSAVLATTYLTPDDPTRIVGVVVLAHGYAEHSGRFTDVAKALTDANFAVVTHDARGHGSSTGVPFGVIDSFDAIVSDLAGLARHARERHPGVPLFLYGHSMGGLAVLRVAQIAVDLDLAGLVITSPAIAPAESIPAPLVAVVNLIGKLAPGLKTIALEEGAISRRAEVNAAYSADPLVYRGKITAGTGREMNIAMKQAVNDLPKIHCPVLVLHGTADRLTSPSGSLMVVRGVSSPDTEIRLFPGAFHELHNEPERDEVFALITAWLTRHTQPAT